MTIQKIIHLDMDAFYASVEQRDNPELKGRPVAVGGSSERGVVAAASYEARQYGVKSAMPTRTALRLCPQLIIVKPRISYYKESSEVFRSIMMEYTDLVEPLSLDEAYMDVTHNLKNIPSATLIAQEIRERVKAEINLTCSAGISINKFLAKVASDLNKPDGLTLIGPEVAEEFIEKLPVHKFHGIGKVTSEKLNKMGIMTGRDLKKKSEKEMIRILGKSGSFYYKLVRGEDSRKVNPDRITKSQSTENTFEKDLRDREEVIGEINILCDHLEERVWRKSIMGRTLTIKVKYNDFTQITRSKTVNQWLSKAGEFKPIANEILQQVDLKEGIRLLGVGISNLNTEEESEPDGQLTLRF